MGAISFNAAEVEPQAEFQPLPAGAYLAVAVSSEVKDTKTGGEMVVYKMQIIDGEYANRTIFARFNVKNASAQAEQIGKQQLSAFCHAVGVLNLTDTDELLNRPVQIRVKVREASGSYGPSNEVAGFSVASGAPAAPVASAARPAAPAPAARPATGGARPWQRSAA